jgi:hypothetical protein
MKKTFLILCLAGSITASAQQKELFNIEEHLKKKIAESLTLPDPTKLISPAHNQATVTVMPVQPLSYTLTGNDVVYFGNGTMPCVKPAKGQVYTTPNPPAGKNIPVTMNPMPNGAMEDKKLPSR